MSDSFEFTLHNPLTKEDWDKILDVEHENTRSVTFQTPQGRQVRYIKCEVLDKIRAEIKALTDGVEPERIWNVDVLAIVDKYKAESEDKE